ncbi:MAG: hypothetical protein AAB377_00645 [Patescibacteria group bacterium]
MENKVKDVLESEEFLEFLSQLKKRDRTKAVSILLYVMPIKRRLASRKALSQEKGITAYTSKQFKDDVIKVRKILSIPRSLSRNFVTRKIGDEPEENIYFSLKSSKMNVKLKHCVEHLLKKYNLEDYFYNDVQWQILNNVPPHDYSIYNLEFLKSLVQRKNWRKIPSAGLSTGEKFILKQEVRRELKIKDGRPLKESAKDYAVFLDILGKSKNNRRRIRNLDDTLKTFSGKKYKELANELQKSQYLPDEIDRLEKRKYRFKKRHPFLKVKK